MSSRKASSSPRVFMASLIAELDAAATGALRVRPNRRRSRELADATRMLSDQRAPARARARRSAAGVDGHVRRPPSLPLPAAHHGQLLGLGAALPGGLHRRMERR